MNPSRRSALLLSIVAHLLALFALVHWSATLHSSKMETTRSLAIHLIPVLPTAPFPDILIKKTGQPIASALQKKAHQADQTSKSPPTAEVVTTEPAPAPQSEAKPLFTDPAALVKAYRFEDSKSDLQRAIESHGGTVKVIPKSKYEEFHDAAEFASIPDCLGPDALRHDPPKIGPVGVGGLLALPFLAHAALTGKCK